jgi:hypothetical protein
MDKVVTMYMDGVTSKELAHKQAQYHSDVRFRGKPIDSLTRDEAIEALRQALTEVKRMNSNWLPPGILF